MTQTRIKTRQFLNPDQLLREVPIAPGMVVADLGCGNGHYAVAAGSLAGAKGQVLAFYVLEDALSQTAAFARLRGIQNVSTKQCDLEKMGSCDASEQSVDAVIVSNILHQLRNKDNVVREAYRLLKTGGHLLAVEWKKDALFGPPRAERLEQDELARLLERSGFRPVRELPAGSFHFALLYEK